jgi:hypothetical protein
MDLAAVTQLIQQMPDQVRADTLLEIKDEMEPDSSRAIEVINACQLAGISRFFVAANAGSAVGQEIERLTSEAQAFERDLQAAQQELLRINQELNQKNPEVFNARNRRQTARERLDALRSFEAHRLPAVVGQDPRYQQLKAEYETAVLDGDKPAQERARARLQEWVEVIYRPELESEAELADRRLEESIAEEQEHRKKQQSLQAQQRELQGKLTAAQERMNQLNTLLNRTQ